MLIFEDGLQLSEHLWVVHRERRATKLEFGFNGDSDEETKVAPVRLQDNSY